MRVLTGTESRTLDQKMKDVLNVDDGFLMEVVAGLCAEKIFEVLRKLKIEEVRILCGPGNNGGDGLAIARHLLAFHFPFHLPLKIFYSQGAASDRPSSEICTVQLERLKKLNTHGSVEFYDLAAFISFPPSPKKLLLVDALFGTGLNRPLKEPYLSLIHKANSLSAVKVSIDTPSGLDVDRGVDFGACVQADFTLSVGAPKPGFFTADGPLQIGQLKIVQAGFNLSLLPESAETHWVKTKNEVKAWIPQRSKRSHKGSVGKCHLLVGSKEFPGAAHLVGLGALSSGATYLQLYGDSSLKQTLKFLPELVFKGEYLNLKKELHSKDVCILGSGVSSTEELKHILLFLIEEQFGKVVLDATALKWLPLLKRKIPETWVCTPHPKEMAELLDMTTQEVEADRFGNAQKAQAQFGGQFLLKGHQPILKTAHEWWSLPFGDHRLGKAGTGDLLAGIIGGLMVQMDNSAKATALAVYTQAEAAKIMTKGRNPLSLTTSEIPLAIGKALF